MRIVACKQKCNASILAVTVVTQKEQTDYPASVNTLIARSLMALQNVPSVYASHSNARDFVFASL